MNIRKLEFLLKSIKSGKTSVEEAVAQLKSLPFEDLGFTRIDHHRSLQKVFSKSQYYPRPRVLTYLTHPVKFEGKGTILVITAGTTDIPVAEEAAVTAQFMGNLVETLYDVGVAGIHRLLSERVRLASARVLHL